MISRQKLNVLYLMGNQGVNYIMPLLVFPFLMHVLGPKKFGSLSFSLATVQFLILLTDYGFNYSATKSISIAGQDKQVISQVFFRTMWAKILLCLICFIALLVMIEMLDTYAAIKDLLFINFLAVVGTVIYPLWLYQGLERMGAITLFSVLSRGCVLICFYFLVKNENDINAAMLLLAVPNILAGCFALVTIYREKLVFWVGFSVDEIKKALLEGGQVFSSTLLTSMYTLMTPVVMGFVAGPVSVGYLNVANTVKQAVCGVFSPLLQAYFPRVNALYVTDKNASRALASKIFKYVMSMLIFISAGLFLMSGLIVEKAFGAQYAAAIPVLKVLAFAPFFIMANSVMGLLFMIPRGDMRGYLRSIAAGAVFSLIIVVPAAYYLKESGGALTLLLVEMVVSAFMIFRIRQYKKNQ
ncbi:oligosaccharide flippase family protein [Janthinobacterium sp. SUN128]|uniref:oligosaccharide flippase family protein n=1 Tax=Janthinobacterium sp. SUN128 TaxID=3014790 RepID=UPI002713470C|nr:oligosaccharide flippase family protein [Janthinobacterium sp. SUN128]MDO8035046.1 oligosaccharide flippase family protein [Janthinobacterium sp. SUN128]